MLDHPLMTIEVAIVIYLIRKRQARIAMTGLTLLEIENCNREADSHALD